MSDFLIFWRVFGGCLRDMNGGDGGYDDDDDDDGGGGWWGDIKVESGNVMRRTCFVCVLILILIFLTVGDCGHVCLGVSRLVDWEKKRIGRITASAFFRGVSRLRHCGRRSRVWLSRPKRGRGNGGGGARIGSRGRGRGSGE